MFLAGKRLTMVTTPLAKKRRPKKRVGQFQRETASFERPNLLAGIYAGCTGNYYTWLMKNRQFWGVGSASNGSTKRSDSRTRKTEVPRKHEQRPEPYVFMWRKGGCEMCAALVLDVNAWWFGKSPIRLGGAVT